MTKKQSTILSAHVKDFTRLMSRYDVTTVRAINHHRRVMSRQVVQHRGRIVIMSGGSLLAVFNCARLAVGASAKNI